MKRTVINAVVIVFCLTLGGVFIINTPTSAQPEKFENFLKSFANDSVFQASRIQFPLKYFFQNNETFDFDSTEVAQTEYQYNKLHYNLIECTEAYTMIYDNFKSELRDTNERVFQWKGFTGMDKRYYFKRKFGKWYLVKIQDFGT